MATPSPTFTPSFDTSPYFPPPLSYWKLPEPLPKGLIALAVFGFISFFTTVALLGLLAHRLYLHRRTTGTFAGFSHFIYLIFNLVLADMQQSLAFVISIHWLNMDAMVAPSLPCFAQGWFLSTGDVGSGVWVLIIAIHTYVSVVFGYKMGDRAFGIGVALCWIFIYGLATIGVTTHGNDLYVEAGAWCWINDKYESDRLLLHYLWVFIAEFGTIIIYIACYFSIRRRLDPSVLHSNDHPNAATSNPRYKHTLRVARYMILYPLVYCIVTLPLAAGRMAAMAGNNPSLAYYIVAGAFLTSSGFLDVLVYSLTRRILLLPGGSSGGNKDNANSWSMDRVSRANGTRNGTGRFGITTTIGASGGTLVGASKLQRGVGRGRSSSDQDRTGSEDDLFKGLKAETTIEVTSAPAEEGYPAAEATVVSVGAPREAPARGAGGVPIVTGHRRRETDHDEAWEEPGGLSPGPERPLPG